MSALPENAFTLLEKRANAKRSVIYNVALWAFVAIAVVVGLSVWTVLVFDEGVQVGRRLEKKLAHDTPKPAPANCRELAKICAAQVTERIKR